ncbi:MAG TPA: hypothetical protein VL947_00225 [Cytophagales bacterium]|nr:hypothetical protein [Cytophagales bacterium]
MDKLGLQIMICLGVWMAPLCKAQDYKFDLARNANKVFYTDTIVFDGHTALQKQVLDQYISEKYQSQKAPITYKDSLSAYIISYSSLKRKSTLWYTAKFEKQKDSTRIILFQFEIQEPEEYNTPTPGKTTLEDLYTKYHKSQKPGPRAAYAVLFDDIQTTVIEAKEALADMISKK